MSSLKMLVCLLFSTFLYSSAFAQIQEHVVKASIDEVKIYLQGAEIIRTKEINLPKGKHRLIFSDLSPLVNAQSVQVTASENTSILSITNKTNFRKPKKAKKEAQVLLDSIELLRMEQQDLNDLLRAYQKEEEILQKNQDLKGQEKGLTTEELIKVANFYRSRYREIFKEKTQISRKVQLGNQQITQFNQELSQMNADNRPTSEVYLELNVKSVATTKVKLRYVVSSAGWSPIYDLRAGELNEPINLNYRALAFNNTGVDWNDVKISLSTADPNQSASKPLLSPWMLNQQSFANNSQMFKQEQGRLNMEVQAMDNSFNNALNKSLSVSPGNAGANDVRIEFEAISVSELSTDFMIDEPYSIPSDRKPYSIDIKNYDLEASFRHYAVPKMEKEAFLLAQITGWEELDLIDGPMNVYHKESYVGQASLNTRTLRDTLDLSLGRDKNVMVTRVKQTDLSKKQLFGSDRKVTMAYKINVKNNHKFPINIEIQDQIPLSNRKEITVSLLSSSNAEYTESTGKLVWKFDNIQPADKRVLDFSFSIRHPKGEVIQYEKQRSILTPRYY